MATKLREVRFRRLVDLSQGIGPETQMFPAYPQPAFTQWTTREVHGFLAESLFMVSHTGTHLDAPFHFEPRGKKLDALSVDRFFVPGHVLDLHDLRPGERIEPSQLRAVRKRSGRPVHGGDAVLLRSGWERKQGSRAYLFENPGLGAAAAKELVSWGVGLVGIDSPNMDVAGDATYPAHHVLLRSEVPVIENVTNLAALGSGPFTLAAFPLLLQGATGSPIRLVALVA